MLNVSNYPRLKASIQDLEVQMNALLMQNKKFHGLAITDISGTLYQNTYMGYDPQTLHPLYSVTKSITAWMALLALVMTNNQVDARVVDIVPRLDWQDLILMNPNLKQLTIKHLLNMQGGFEWSEVENFYNENNPFQLFLKAQDPLKMLLSQRMTKGPGVETAYNSGLSHLLGFCVQGLTGQTLEQFTCDNLFHPLNIVHYNWERDDLNHVYGGHGLHLSLNDVTKIAQMLAGQGVYNHQTILPKSIIARLQNIEVQDFRGYMGYGNGMWHVSCEGHHLISAFGHKGQRLYWSKERGIVITFLGDVKPEFGRQEQLLRILLRNTFI